MKFKNSSPDSPYLHLVPSNHLPIRSESSYNTLTRALIRERLQKDLKISTKQANQLLNGIVDQLKEMILENSHVKIACFGTFLIHKKKERLGRNPKTKEDAKISPRKSVSFRPSALLKEAIRGDSH